MAEKKEIQYINVSEDPGALYSYMRKYDFLDHGAPKEMPDDFDELTWFDGDPDMIKVNDQVWYFDFSPVDTKRENICFYWAECDSEEETESIVSMLKEFRERNLQMAEPNNWDTWHNMKNGIAYRGGSGYLYIIYLAPPKPIYTINLFDEISCEDLTPTKYSIDYESMDSAIEAARKAIAEFPAADYSLVEATVFAGEYRDSFGNGLGEPEAVYVISNQNEMETRCIRAALGYTNPKVDEYAEESKI